MDQISPQVPNAKRTPLNSEEATEANMKVSDLMAMFDQLATKNDVNHLREGFENLRQENQMLSRKVDVLSKRCDELERQAAESNVWRNGGNIIVKMNKNRDANESKRRVTSICADLM